MVRYIVWLLLCHWSLVTAPAVGHCVLYRLYDCLVPADPAVSDPVVSQGQCVSTGSAPSLPAGPYPTITPHSTSRSELFMFPARSAVTHCQQLGHSTQQHMWYNNTDHTDTCGWSQILQPTGTTNKLSWLSRWQSL